MGSYSGASRTWVCNFTGCKVSNKQRNLTYRRRRWSERLAYGADRDQQGYCSHAAGHPGAFRSPDDRFLSVLALLRDLVNVQTPSRPGTLVS